MNVIAAFTITGAAVLVHMSVAPAFSVFGAHPNIVVALLVWWAVARAKEETFLLVPAAGVFLGLLDSHPLGLALLALSPVILLSRLPDLRLLELDAVPALLILIITTLLYEATFLVALALDGEPIGWVTAIVDVLAPAVAANLLLFLLILGIARLLHTIRSSVPPLSSA